MSSFKVLSSNTLCAAKWLQVTLDLYHGLSKSCHHTNWNNIDTQNAKLDYTHLFNTPRVLQDRVEMKDGIRPKSCHYCWDIEDKTSRNSSDRFKKSIAPWSAPYIPRINVHGDFNNIHPSYLEVVFDHTCNLKCLYCSADSSSSIEKEMKNKGNISIEVSEHRKKRQIKSNQHNELISIFFSSLDQILSHLHTLRVTGGEPLLTPYLKKLMTHILNNSYPELTFAINTNLSLHSSFIDRFNDQIKKLNTKVKELQIFISIDTYGRRSEEIRKGLEYNLFEENLSSIIDNNLEVTIIMMVTLTSYSIHSFIDLLHKVQLLKKKHKKLIIEITPLKQPSYLSIQYLTNKENTQLTECYQYMQENDEYFSSHERQNLKTCLELVETHEDDSHHILTRDSLINEVKSL